MFFLAVLGILWPDPCSLYRSDLWYSLTHDLFLLWARGQVCRPAWGLPRHPRGTGKQASGRGHDLYARVHMYVYAHGGQVWWLDTYTVVLCVFPS